MELKWSTDPDAGVKFPRLKSLTFADTNLADDDLKCLAALPARGAVVVLDRTNITDAGLAHLAAVKDLRSLCLRTTRATPEGVKQLKECCRNWELDSRRDFRGAMRGRIIAANFTDDTDQDGKCDNCRLAQELSMAQETPKPRDIHRGA